MIARILILSALAAGYLGAEEPVWKKQLTAATPGPFGPTPTCTLNFVVSWKGLINAGELHMDWGAREFNKTGETNKTDVYVVRSSAASTGLAAMLFSYQSTFRGELDPATLRPRVFKAVEIDERKAKTTTTRYFSDHVEYDESAKSVKDGSVSEDKVTFRFSQVYDIFSAMLHVRSQKLEDGDQIFIVIHPFDTAHLLHVTVKAHEIHDDRKTIRLSVGMDKIDRKTLELKPYKKMKKEATLWLSDDAERIPVELRAEVFIGDVRATLTGCNKHQAN